MEERRQAPRTSLPEGIEASVSGSAVTMVELSAAGARLEHESRFPLLSPRLTLTWGGVVVELPFQVVRSEIVGRRSGVLVYGSGIQFAELGASGAEVIASILGWGQQRDSEPTAPVEKERLEAVQSRDDSWTRQVRFLKDDLGDDDLPYAQFRLTGNGWEKEYVPSPEQPEDGFTITRADADFAELQRTFEVADPETRRMMRIALETKLAASVDAE